MCLLLHELHFSLKMNIPSSKLEVNEENDDLQVKDDDNTKKVKKT